MCSSPVDFAAMSDAQNDYFVRFQGVNNSVVSNPVFSQAGELSLQNWIRSRLMNQFLLNPVEDARNLRDCQFPEIMPHGLFVHDAIRQEMLSAPRQ
jgi:hypothetical protein